VAVKQVTVMAGEVGEFTAALSPCWWEEVLCRFYFCSVLKSEIVVKYIEKLKSSLKRQ
jgi:hypothetical protein